MRPMRNALLALLMVLSCGCTRAAELDLSRLHLPPGFRISVFAELDAKPRLMAWSPGGVLLATATSDGTVLALPDKNGDGRADRVAVVLRDLNAPHGIAFHEGKLYVAETGGVSRHDWNENTLAATGAQRILELPPSGQHFTRTILFSGGKLYASAGSSCNVCEEEDERRAAVMRFDPDGSHPEVFARGLRNAVGLAENPRTGTVWTTENGRDWLGDDLPPDEINDLGKLGGHFGWPYCYGDRKVDPEFQSKAEQKCPSTMPVKVDLQAHSAPLGLAFYHGEMFPPEYRGDLYVAFHGSWNRSRPTGYKVARVKLKDGTEPEGVEDFITGWLPPNASKATRWMGRPVGITFGRDGSMYVSDDAAGVIYRVTYSK